MPIRTMPTKGDAVCPNSSVRAFEQTSKLTVLAGVGPRLVHLGAGQRADNGQRQQDERDGRRGSYCGGGTGRSESYYIGFRKSGKKVLILAAFAASLASILFPFLTSIVAKT